MFDHFVFGNVLKTRGSACGGTSQDNVHELDAFASPEECWGRCMYATLITAGVHKNTQLVRKGVALKAEAEEGLALALIQAALSWT
jgi:hypothetical protein